MQLARLIPIAKTPEDVAVHLPPVRQATTEVTHCTANSALELPITGDLTATTMTRWDAVLLEKWEQTPKATILHLDLSRVPFMDTSGLGFLIRAMKLARKRPGGNMALHNPSPNVCNVIKLANMQAVLGVSLP
jgi:anti-anti-sigma factor